LSKSKKKKILVVHFTYNVATSTILYFQVIRNIKSAVSQLPQEEMTANTAASISEVTADASNPGSTPPTTKVQDTSSSPSASPAAAAIVSVEKQLTLLEEAIVWLEWTLSDLEEFKQLGNANGGLVKDRQCSSPSSSGATSSLLCC